MAQIVTLLTDFGVRDSYVAEMKGVILSQVRDVQLVDVSHEVSPADIESAMYIVGRVWKQFPDGTIHLVVVDPGVGSSRKPLALKKNRHFFVGPDNGVFSHVLHDAEARELQVPADASQTFHGRDVFAPAVASLAAGKSFSRLGPVVTELVRYADPGVQLVSGRIAGTIVYVDRFGNLVSNLRAESLTGGEVLKLEDEEVGPVRRSYSDVALGESVAVIGSGGTVEISVREGSAAEKYGAGIGTRCYLVTSS